MNRGIVMEMKAKTLIVMTQDGHFSEIPRASRQCQVGEEIVYAEPAGRTWVRKPVAWTSGAVAAAVFCLVVFSGMQGAFASPEVVAYVSMDINPSVELGIDAKEKVRELKGLNSDGDTLIQNIDYKGKSVAELTDELLDRAGATVLKDKDSADIVIASTKVKPDAKLDEAQVATQLETQLKQHAEKVFPKKEVEVTAFPAPETAREAAQAEDISTGKLAIYLKAVENGQNVTLDEFKSKSVHDIAAQYGGIGKLIGQQPIKKSEIEKLVQEELKGSSKEASADEKKDNSGKEKAVLPSASPKGTKKSTSTPTPHKPTPTPTKPDKSSVSSTKEEHGNSSKKDEVSNGNGKGDTGKNDNGKNDNGKNDNGKNDTNKNDNGKSGKSEEDNKNTDNGKGNTNDNGNGKDSHGQNASASKNDNQTNEGVKPAEDISGSADGHSALDKPDNGADKNGKSDSKKDNNANKNDENSNKGNGKGNSKGND